MKPLPRLLVTAGAIYLPFTLLGYGADSDSYGVARAASTLWKTGAYAPSRWPGYFVHEVAVTPLIAIGGSVLSNLGTLFMALVALASFVAICKFHSVPRPYLLATILAIHPVFWVNATCTIDYVWAMGLGLAAHHFFDRRRTFLAGLAAGLAIGTRLAAVLWIGSVLATYVWTRPHERGRLAIAASICGIVVMLSYVPVYYYAGGTFAFLTYSVGDWSVREYVARFAYKNVYFWGLPALALLLAVAPRVVRGRGDLFGAAHREIGVISCLVIAGLECLFLYIPLENEYLLPMLPYVLMVLGITLRGSKRILVALGAALFLYNLVNINIARPDVPDNATAAAAGVWLEPGYLIQNCRARIDARNAEWSREKMSRDRGPR